MKGASMSDLDFCKQYSAWVASGASLDEMQKKIVDSDGKPVYTTGASIAARVSKLRKQLNAKRNEIPADQHEKRQKEERNVHQWRHVQHKPKALLFNLRHAGTPLGRGLPGRVRR